MSPCDTIVTDDGIEAIACSRGRRPRKCRVCRAYAASYLCGYPNPNKRSGTCDAALCGACARVVGKDRHHCPSHPEQQPALPGVVR